MKQLKLYIDTSIVGGCLDDEFAEESRALIQLARDGRIMLVVSDLLVQELQLAPADVQQVLASLPEAAVESVSRSDETARLRDAYLSANVVGTASANDAHHVAIATVTRADMLVSWNFRHIVHFDKMRGFNAVNLREGYGSIEIHSPKEVV